MECGGRREGGERSAGGEVREGVREHSAHTNSKIGKIDDFELWKVDHLSKGILSS